MSLSLTDRTDSALETLERDRVALCAHQESRLRAILGRIADGNGFYRRKLGAIDPESFRLADLAKLPFTTKDELVADQRDHPPFGTDLSLPLDRYVRMHLTSGTNGRPLRWLDTEDSWQSLLSCWRRVYRAIGVGPADRVFVAFSFGPFIGFWGAFEAAQQIGALALTGGGLSTDQRLDHLIENEATVLVATPTYALHLADVAASRGIDLRRSAIRLTLHAGEPGASVSGTRERLQAAFGVECFDHAGATELGAWGYPGAELRMYMFEPMFLPELVVPGTEKLLTPQPGGTRGELVLTSLGRDGSPLLRCRTGDLVDLVPGDRDDPRWFLHGGVLARVDDMFVVRGVNVYPSAIESIVREHPEIVEFRARVSRHVGTAELGLEIEVRDADPQGIAAALAANLHRRLNLRVVITTAEPGSLPRFELKARRFVFDDPPTASSGG